jgi:S1-C subfamily serine protease
MIKIIERIFTVIGAFVTAFIIMSLLFGNITITTDNDHEVFNSSPVKFSSVGAILEHQNKQNVIGVLFPTAVKKPKYTASKELDKKLNNQTVSIMMFGRGVGSCSGTVIDEKDGNHYVLTAKHCINLTEEMYVEHTNVLYIITSVDDDLAVLVTDGKIPNKKVAVISDWEAYIDEDVYHYSYPSGITYKTSGKVTRYTKDHQYLDFKAIGGCSGGGIFNSDGELVSVLWGGFDRVKPESPLKTIAEPLKDVRIFLYQIGLRI